MDTKRKARYIGREEEREGKRKGKKEVIEDSRQKLIGKKKMRITRTNAR